MAASIAYDKPDWAQDPVVAASRFVEESFPEAPGAMVTGSCLTDQRTRTSDLDILILLPDGHARWRRTLLWMGWPVEVFANSRRDFETNLAAEIASRHSPLVRMLATGRIIVDAEGHVAALAQDAALALRQGPGPVEQAERDRTRYALTDRLEDLRDADPAERAWLIPAFQLELARAQLLLAGAFTGSGKWLARLLEEQEPGLAARLAEAAQTGLRGDLTQLEDLTDHVLHPYGGRLLIGYVAGPAPDWSAL